MPAPTQPDSSFTETEIDAWAMLLECSAADAAVDLGLGLSQGVVTIIDTDNQSKKNRARAKAILKVGGG